MEELEKYPKTNPFKAPEGYFDNFERNLSEKLMKKNSSENGLGKLSSIKPYLAIAAGFLLIFSLWFMFLSKIDKKNVASETRTNNEDLILTYFESVSSSEMIDILCSEQFQNQDFAINYEKDVDLLIDDIDESIILDEMEDI